jgi:aminoglycoside/choline kinase family phosphotransferase
MTSAADPSSIEGQLVQLVRQALGRGITRIQPLSAGLGLRRFLRLYLDGPPGTAVARIEAAEDPAGRPAGVPPEPSLEPLRAHLERAGLPVPASYGRDASAGIDLLEDLGERSLRRAAAEASPAERHALYAEACSLIPRLQRVTDPGGLPAFQRRLDAELLAYKADLFARYGLGRPASPGEARAVAQAFARVGEVCDGSPQRLAHRDFQSENLHTREGAGGPRLVMIDLQGAFLAPPEYDAVCLLRDSYADLADAEGTSHAQWLRTALPDAPDPEVFAQRFDLLTLTRKAKDLARYRYAWLERGDTRYRDCVGPAVRALRSAAPRAAARDPQLGALAELMAGLEEEPG